MSRAAPRKKSKRDESDESSDEADEDRRMPYFIPENGNLDIEVMIGYVRGLLDSGSRIKTGEHPSRRGEKGFWVESIVAIGMEDIRAMIEDTRLFRRENSGGYYVNSQTMKRRRQLGRPQANKERPIAAAKSQKESEDPRTQRQGTRASVEPESRYLPPTQSRASADNVTMSQRAGSIASPSPRPASAQPAQADLRRPSAPSQYSSSANTGYIQATAQYTVSANIPQASYYNNSYDSAPPPYEDGSKRDGGGGQPSTTGTQGFRNLTATSGPPNSRPPNQGQRRHDAR